MNQSRQAIDNPEKAQKMTLLVWAGLIVGQVLAFGGAVLALRGGQIEPLPPQQFNNLYSGSIIALIVLLFAGYAIRYIIYSKSAENGIISPFGYFAGNLIFFSLAEAAALFSMVVMVTGGELNLYPILPALVALLAQIMNFPSGKPMYQRDFSDNLRS